MLRFIASCFTCAGIIVLLAAAYGYTGYLNFSPTAIEENFVLRALANRFVQNARGNIDAAQLYLWMRTRLIGMAAAGIGILLVSAYFMVRSPSRRAEQLNRGKAE